MQYLPLIQAAGWRAVHRPNTPSRYWKPTSSLWPLRSLQYHFGMALRRWNRRRDIHDSASFDVIFLNRDLQEGNLQWEQRLFARNPQVVFDFDDAIFLGEKKRAHIGWICRNASWVTPGNEHLAEFARQFTDRVTVIPSTVATERYEVHRHGRASDGKEKEPRGRNVRVGWLGSNLSIRETLFPYWDMIGRLQRQIGFDFVVCSHPRPTSPDNSVRWQYVEWSPTVEEQIARHMDIGIMPLVDNEFQRGKCGMKLLQYMAAAIPVVAYPLGVNTALVNHGCNGFLADTEEAWREAITALVESSNLREEFGLAGRHLCDSRYSTRIWFPKLLEILERVVESHRDVPPSRHE